MTSARQEEEIARALLRTHVADIRPAEDLIDRIEKGVRRRRTVRRTALSATALAAGALATVFAVAIGQQGSHTDAAGSIRLTANCKAPLPNGRLITPPAPTTPGATRTLVPGRPVAAVSCSIGGDTRTVSLSNQELNATVAALNSAALVKAPSHGGLGECEAAIEPYTSLYLIFEYADGTQFTVVAYPSKPCGANVPVTWHVNNGAAAGTVQSSVLDSLSNRNGAAQSTSSG